MNLLSSILVIKVLFIKKDKSVQLCIYHCKIQYLIYSLIVLCLSRHALYIRTCFFDIISNAKIS